MMDRRTFLKLSTIGLTMSVAGQAGAASLQPVQGALASLARLKPVHGTPITPTDLVGRPVLVTFWASWCPPCRWEFEQLNTLAGTYRSSGLSIVGVNVFEDFGGLSSPAKQKRFIEDTAPVFPLIAGTDQTRQDFGGVTRIPTVFLFDETGGLAWSFVHATGAKKTHVTEQELSAELMKLGYRPG